MLKWRNKNEEKTKMLFLNQHLSVGGLKITMYTERRFKAKF